MRVKTLVSLLTLLIFLSGFCIHNAGALPTSSVSLQGNVGFVIDLVFPEEARPADLITHNLTLTATTSVFWFNVTLVVKALVDADWQQVYNVDIPSRSVTTDEKIYEQGTFTVPKGAHDRLYCFVHVSTQAYTTSREASYIFYTTQIRSVTYDELLNDYNELLNDYNELLNDYNGLMANYSGLLADHKALLESYDELSARYSALNPNYTLILDQYSSLQTAYSSLNSSYHSQKESYDALRADYDSLQASYSMLNTTCNALRTENSNLGRLVGSANSELSLSRNLMYAFIAAALVLGAIAIYVKRKKPPVVYIRKQEV